MSSITKVLTKNSVAKSAILEDRNKSRALSKSRQSTGIGLAAKCPPTRRNLYPPIGSKEKWHCHGNPK
jgi:hypothetical protein